jgi:hypothetical protein
MRATTAPATAGKSAAATSTLNVSTTTDAKKSTSKTTVTTLSTSTAANTRKSTSKVVATNVTYQVTNQVQRGAVAKFGTAVSNLVVSTTTATQKQTSKVVVTTVAYQISSSELKSGGLSFSTGMGYSLLTQALKSIATSTANNLNLNTGLLLGAQRRTTAVTDITVALALVLSKPGQIQSVLNLQLMQSLAANKSAAVQIAELYEVSTVVGLGKSAEFQLSLALLLEQLIVANRQTAPLVAKKQPTISRALVNQTRSQLSVEQLAELRLGPTDSNFGKELAAAEIVSKLNEVIRYLTKA